MTKNKTNMSIIPHLRFPGFVGEWVERPLSTFLFEHKTKSDGKSEVHSVSVAKGVINQVEYLGRSFAAADTSKYNLAKPNDIIYTKSPTGAFPYGIVKMNKNPYNVIVSPLYAVYSPINKYIGYILDSYFESPANTNNYLSSLVQKGAKNTINITNETFVSKAICLPTDEKEQQRIAECLSELDDLTSAQDQKVEALKEKKKGLMQQLFPQPGETSPRLRFPGFSGDWEDLKISDVADVLQGYGFPDKYQGQKSGELPFCKVGDISAAVDKGERIITKAANYVDYSLLSTLHAKPIPVGSTIFAKIGEAIRSNKRIKTGVPCLIDNNAAAVKAKNEDMDDFMFYLMSQIKLGDYSGGIVPSVNKSTIESIPILVPPIPAEQQKIASCLSALDDNIANEAVKFEVLKNHKKGLMQQLFP